MPTLYSGQQSSPYDLNSQRYRVGEVPNQGMPPPQNAQGQGMPFGQGGQPSAQPNFTPMANQYTQQNPGTNDYKNQLNTLLTNPNSFSGTPGYQFALDQGMQGVERSNSASRNSGNALAALAKYGTGLAQQDYGNQVDRLGKLSGQQDQFNINNEQNRLTGENNTNQYNLGGQRNANDATNNQNNYQLGLGRNANDANRADQEFGLGMQRNANEAQNNYWNYDNNRTQNSNNAARNENDWNNNQQRNNIDWFNAGTNRGNSMSNNYISDQTNQLNWANFDRTGQQSHYSGRRR